jgi:putative two-component system response regulator
VTKHILIVDDDQRVLDALRHSLHPHSDDWAVTFARRPEEAREALLETAYDAVVTDIRIPALSGLDLLARIRQSDCAKDVPVVALTASNDRGPKARALDHATADPRNPQIDAGQLIARLRSVLEAKEQQDDLRAADDLPAERVQQQSANLTQSRMSVICRLGMAAEFRDEETGNHVIRVGCYSRVIAAAMRMPRSYQEMLLLAAPLHDIGKIGIPDSVLLKRGPLGDEEWRIMQRHCEIGACILREQSKAMVPLLD